MTDALASAAALLREAVISRTRLRLLALLPVLLLAGCGDPMTTRVVLERSGYADIRINRWGGWFQCDDGWGATAFKAKKWDGSEISGVVCVDHFYLLGSPQVIVLKGTP